MKRLSRRKLVVFALIASFIGLLVIEGLLGFLWIGAEIIQSFGTESESQEDSRPRLLQEDKNLGWTSVPGLSVPDYFGKGRHLTINSQGARGNREYATEKSADGYRIVCLGDSFTFGDALGDEDCFPAVLQKLNPQIEAINLAVPGYSTGQMWLRAELEGWALKPDLVLVVLIWQDIERLGTSIPRFEARNPEFRINEGKIEATNIPFALNESGERNGSANQEDIVGLITQKSAIARALTNVIPSRRTINPGTTEGSLDKLIELTSLMFTDMNQKAQKSRSTFAVVLLPTIADLTTSKNQQAYTLVEERLRILGESEGFPFLGLREIFLRRTEEEWRGLYFDPVMDKNRHCSARGNRLIASEIQRWLMESVASYPAEPSALIAREVRELE